jgi:hypothetical protein
MCVKQWTTGSSITDQLLSLTNTVRINQETHGGPQYLLPVSVKGVDFTG